MGDLIVLRAGERLEDAPDVSVDVEACVLASLEAARLRRELRRLPELERLVIAWRFGLGCPRLGHREIARRLGVAVGTAWNIEQRGLERLRSAYGARDAA